MAGLNKCMFIGRLGRDPEIRYSNNGSAITNFSLAASESWTDKNTGEKQERTEWVRVVAFGKPAEILEKYLNKGSLVYIEGRMQTRSWDKDGQTHYTTEVVVNDFQFLGGNQQNQSGGQQQGNYQNQGYQQPRNQPHDFRQEVQGQYQQGPNQQGYQQGQNQNQGQQGGPGPDSDIPF